MADEQQDGQQAVPEFEISITGEGVAIKRKVAEAAARQLINLLLSGGSAQTLGPAVVASALPMTQGLMRLPAPGEKVSLSEWLEQVNARKLPEKILAMAVFVTDIAGQPGGNKTFTRADIRKCFRLAHEPEPGNFPRDFAVTAQYGWIAPEGADPNIYFVTRKGYAAIEQQFGGPTPLRLKRRKTKTGEQQSDGEANNPGD